MTAERTSQGRPLDRLLRRVLDSGRPGDLAVLAVAAALPCGIAYAVGAFRTVVHDGVRYHGYLERYNWSGLVVLLPFALFLLRFVVRKIAGNALDGRGDTAPIVALLPEDRRASGALGLRAALLSWSRAHTVALVLAVAAIAADAWEVAGAYWDWFRTGACAPREHDWSVLACASGAPPGRVWANLGLVAAAYAVELVIVFLAFLLVATLFHHNALFLRMIDVRRRAGAPAPIGDPPRIPVVLDDDAARFGLQKAHRAFDVQVWVLVLVGLCAVVSRVANAPTRAPVNLGASDPDEIARLLSRLREGFPDVGQGLLAAGWLALLATVTMPAFVKLLPFRIHRRLRLAPAEYLRTLVPDEALGWREAARPTREEVDAAAAKFARSSFWPSGDGSARLLFFFAFAVMLVLLFPVTADGTGAAVVVGFYVSLGLVAAGLTAAFFWLLRVPLSVVDDRLVA